MILIHFFSNWFCKVEVTLLDIESKLGMKKALSSYITGAGDVGRCLPINSGTFWPPKGSVCNQISPILPVHGEKSIFKT